MSDMFKKLVQNRQHKTDEGIVQRPDPPLTEVKRRGRPATGKRSDPDWIGRTYYVKSSTDLDVEERLLKLKRLGTDLDKSELVDSLLAAWVKWHQGGDANILIDEISPR